MNSIPDKAHIDKVLSGDKNAFVYFIKTYQEMAYSIAISMVKNEFNANDVVQNSFIRAFKALRSYRSDAKFSTWLYKIVVNESLKFIKKNKRSQEFITFMDDPFDYSVSFNEAIENFEKKDQKLEIKKTLNLMKPKEALLLKLFYLHEESIPEIEKITGFTKSNIKVLLHRARKSFLALSIQHNNLNNG
ncbi:sigma-70 family RNA polymerase sigma factor [Aquimarina sp. AD1]|uniref:RNA polymerase sigma factor n=1 Tax=Aquimarina sp. (strain AD1) TaxID=1714848 RepID=UPI000E478ED7|nr:sigma-70 family RNA polymerase sigma factor [Aquimarina sp. AD1]AXT57916.1 sigma-70 family RNA polymerase sigma factor [Aquimarina sp. AD1]RKN15151.1 sigma-70 family RNA polymerase sigma factor [Aquimarina sp. AD1]